MGISYDNCPFCGQRLLKGAMRCMACGGILKTPEEQAESIKRLKERNKRFDTMRLFKIILFFIAMGIIYYFWGDQLMVLIRRILGR